MSPNAELRVANHSGQRYDFSDSLVPVNGPEKMGGKFSATLLSAPRARVSINPGNAQASSLSASRRFIGEGGIFIDPCGFPKAITQKNCVQ